MDVRRMAAALVIAVLATGCVPASTQAPTAVPSATPTPATRPSGSRPSTGRFDPMRITVGLQVVADIPGQPLSIAAPYDGSGRLFVVDQAGRIWTIQNGKRASSPFLDIASRISSGGERGLLGLALHPDFPGDPRFYLDYTDRAGNTVVSEWRLSSSNAAIADPGSERVLLRVDQPFPNHNGGAVVFGPDRHLYVSLGDGGSAGDPQGNGQRLDTLLAKLLRIDVDPTSGRPYGIPPSNPFNATNGARHEIFVTGLRNPWRISFDRATGDLWIGDVGQGAWEEIDVVRAGGRGGENFGWNRMEGFHCYAASDCNQTGLTPPVTEYGHDLGCAVTGGNVYRGTAFPRLAGAYLFSDSCSGRIWAIAADATAIRPPVVVAETGRAISSFGEDEAGELYATDLAGHLLRIVATDR
jgi:glucose/arabinose dehydrogenase